MLLLLIFTVALAACNTAPPAPTATAVPSISAFQEETGESLYLDASQPIEARLDDLLGRMTLAEKVGQMTLIEKNSLAPDDVRRRGIGAVLSGGGGYPDDNTPEGWLEMTAAYQEAALASRLGIPILYGADAVHGHNNLRGATVFPHNIGLGATRDADLVRRVGRITARETLATGVNWNYAPVLAVPQDIRWGRTYEAYSEDTAVVAELGRAFLQGLQGEDLAAAGAMLGTPKHYLADGGAAFGSSAMPGAWLDRGDARIDEATLRDVHLPPYEAAIAAGARSIMVSFSSWRGGKMHAHTYLLSDVLKEELSFTGFLVSDWAALDEIADNMYDAVVLSINAGVDMVMVPYEFDPFIDAVIEAVENGDIPQERIDDAVRRILRVKMEMGLFAAPFPDPDLLPTIGSAEHRAVAREAVRKSVILLKDDDHIVPLDKDAELILLAGEAADDIGLQSGGWTIEWQGKTGDILPGTTLLEGIEAAVSPGTEIAYNRHGRFRDLQTSADYAIVVVGEEPYAEWHGDRETLQLPEETEVLLERVGPHSERVILLLVSGRPLPVAEILPDVDALLAVWLPGSEGGGVADVLFGDYPLQGTLPFTWPRTSGQLPFDFAELATRGCAAPLYPFGYGLRTDSLAPAALCPPEQ